jgi:hypothetical protein
MKYGGLTDQLTILERILKIDLWYYYTVILFEDKQFGIEKVEYKAG